MEFSEEWMMMDFIQESRNFTLDFIAGSVAGVAITLTGHPFDTIKVRMQSDISIVGKSFLSSIKGCYSNEGLKGFLKGMSFPLYSVPLVNAVVFSFHELTKKLFGFNEEEDLNMYEGVICGAFAGLANCLVVTPVELVKCRLQIQQETQSQAFYKGVGDCIKKTFNSDGFKGLYKGNVATVFREIPAYAAQFGGYYYSKQFLSRLRNKPINQLTNLELMLCGAIGGYACWQFSYPQDVIKTLIQTKEIGVPFKQTYKDGGFFSCGKFIYSTQGIRGFWRGFLPCSMRALVANSVLFVTYENSKSYLSDYFDDDDEC